MWAGCEYFTKDNSGNESSGEFLKGVKIILHPES